MKLAIIGFQNLGNDIINHVDILKEVMDVWEIKTQEFLVKFVAVNTEQSLYSLKRNRYCYHLEHLNHFRDIVRL